MPLDGLRAWIGEVEWKLSRRTRVFLALAVIAIGTAGTAIYLAIDAQNGAVSEGDVRTLQEQLEARIGTGTSSASVTQLETEVKALQAQVSELQEGKGGSGTSKGSSGGSTGSSSGSSQGSAGSGSSGGGSSKGTSGQGTSSTGSPGNLQEAIRRAREQQK